MITYFKPALNKLVDSVTKIVALFSFLFFKGTIDALKKMLNFIASEQFVQEYGELFILPIKLNQDFVESFFSSQRQMCGGMQNMTAFVYSYNINGYSCAQTTNALGNKQTNV